MFFSKRNYNRRYPKDYGFIRNLYLNIFVFCFVNPFLFVFYLPKVIGGEKLKKNKKYMYTSNHQSYMDPELICYAAPRNVIAFMAKEELFTKANIFIKAFVISLGAFAVNRDNPEKATFKTVIDIVKHTNWSLGIFPQGTQCFGAKNFDDVKPGFVKLAKISKMDVVPMVINGYKGYNFIPFKTSLTIKVGDPISYELPEEEIYSQWVKYMNENVE